MALLGVFLALLAVSRVGSYVGKWTAITVSGVGVLRNGAVICHVYTASTVCTQMSMAIILTG
jgi:hypothetical protein